MVYNLPEKHFKFKIETIKLAKMLLTFILSSIRIKRKNQHVTSTMRIGTQGPMIMKSLPCYVCYQSDNNKPSIRSNPCMNVEKVLAEMF